MRLAAIIILYLFINSSLRANNKDNKYVMNLIDLASKNVDNNNIKAIQYIEKALEYKNKINDATLLKLYECAGIVFRTQDGLYISLKYYIEQLELQKKLNPKKFIIYTVIQELYITGLKT